MIFPKKTKSLDFKFDGGILEFVEYLDHKESTKNKNGMICSKTYISRDNKSNLDIQCS